MNRLATQLALAMMAVAVIAMIVFALSQVVIVSREFRNLPPAVRFRVDSYGQNRPRPLRPPTDGVPAQAAGRPALPNGEEDLLRGFVNVRTAQSRATVIGLVVAGLMSIALAALLSRTVARPLEAVSLAAERVADGDLAARVEPAAGSSETALLAHNFNRMAGSLERYEEERRAMIADIAHELRTPLAAMQLRLEALLDGLTPFDAGEAERLHRQTALLTRLVEDLRTLSLADAGRLRLDLREVDLREVAGATVDTFRSRAEAEGIELRLDLPDRPVAAQADPDRIAQVLSNLVDNAVRVTPRGGRVTVGADSGELGPELSVRDDGPGVAAAELSQLFERFAQGGDTRGNSGLGLAIVQTLVRLHGGTVEARNLDPGAVFTVTLPPLEPAA